MATAEWAGSQALSFGLNVAAFGAVGDGVTDDTMAISAAIASASAIGGASVVFNPGKTYVLTNMPSTFQGIALQSGVSLDCQSCKLLMKSNASYITSNPGNTPPGGTTATVTANVAAGDTTLTV